MTSSIIIGSGKYIPEKIVTNDYFMDTIFYDEDKKVIDKPNAEIIEKFEAITEIGERRYLDEKLNNSDMATAAGKIALEDAGIDKEELDYVLVANNFGDIDAYQHRADFMPSMSAKVKHNLNIKNEKCRPYDVVFGCPGWVEAMIMADQYIKAGLAKNILVIGSDVLSRTIDEYDRNRMIFADGAGAVVVQALETSEKEGLINYNTASTNIEELDYLTNQSSLNPESTANDKLIRMKGRKIYEYALTKVPALVKQTIDESGYTIQDIKMVLLHQANAKMDHAMVSRLFKLYGINEVPENVAPMTVQYLGNTSVATIPTMYDMVRRGEMEGYTINAGDVVVMASVGAGMNVNAFVYKH